ncbi:MAG: hypothetical protein KKA84_05245 [Bacteroidetes bacterium]|nr:hypothetical protein [Bacteroidota bacterium]
MNKEITDFKKKCYNNYLSDINRELKIFPEPYLFPDGNPIQPVLPLAKEPCEVMLIGAFPSARFEQREKAGLVPIGNNLSPFAEEHYFDGRQVRNQESRKQLEDNYFPKLGIDPKTIWITDLVRVYLYPDPHVNNCQKLYPTKEFINTHKHFKKIAHSQSNMKWIIEEIKLCSPSLIITLGEVPAKAFTKSIRDNEELLNGEIRTIQLDKEYRISHLPHPEIGRRDGAWKSRTHNSLRRLKKEMT